LFIRLSRLFVNLDQVESKLVHDSHGCLVSSISFEVRELTEFTVKVDRESRLRVERGELNESIGIFLADLTLLDEVGNSELEHVLSVVLPDSLEVRLA
jgi:hypothetical protein